MSGEYFTKALGFRSINETQRTASFIASTEAVDSYDEIVAQDWDLTRYQANPVVLFAHDSRDLPIGQCTSIGVVKDQLQCTIKFLPADANPKAEFVWRSIVEGALRGVSVGFRNTNARFEMRDGKEVYVLSGNELREISVVPVPANAEALARMKSVARTAPQDVRAIARDEEKQNMEIEKLLAQREVELKSAEARATVAEKALVELRTQVEDLTKSVKTLTVAKDEAVARAEKAEKSADEAYGSKVKAELDALVGVKMLPADRPELEELAAEKATRPIYERMVAKIKAREDLKVLSSVIGAEKSAPPATTVSGGNGEALANAIFGEKN